MLQGLCGPGRSIVRLSVELHDASAGHRQLLVFQEFRRIACRRPPRGPRGRARQRLRREPDPKPRPGSGENLIRSLRPIEPSVPQSERAIDWLITATVSRPARSSSESRDLRALECEALQSRRHRRPATIGKCLHAASRWRSARRSARSPDRHVQGATRFESSRRRRPGIGSAAVRHHRGRDPRRRLGAQHHHDDGCDRRDTGVGAGRPLFDHRQPGTPADPAGNRLGPGGGGVLAADTPTTTASPAA